MLESIACPKCGQLMVPRDEPVLTANSYDGCLRQCEPCGVAWSNGQSNPTTIYRDPLDNVPAQVRSGYLETLRLAANVQNRPQKLNKAGFSTSEDAVTWTVFNYLLMADKLTATLTSLGLIPVDTSTTPELILWGVRVPDIAPDEHLSRISDQLGEAPQSRSEPDVVVEYPDAMVIIEVKYVKGKNASAKRHNYDPYTKSFDSFADDNSIRASGCYELARNWRIGCDLAGDKKLVLVNLVSAALLADTTDAPAVAQFVAGLRQDGHRRFSQTSWKDFISAIPTPHDAWFHEFIIDRRLVR